MSNSDSFSLRWKHALNNRSFVIQFIIALVVLALTAVLIPHFFLYIQHREGKVLNDPLLNLLHPVDLSRTTFTIIYGALVASVIHLFLFPSRLLMMIEAYCIVTIFRIITLALVPLNDPPGIIVLHDSFVNIFGYDGHVITKDLFFSGHVSTLFLLVLSVHSKVLKIILLCATMAVASLILVQHVHYTIDILAAPFFSWMGVRVTKIISGKAKKNSSVN